MGGPAAQTAPFGREWHAAARRPSLLELMAVSRESTPSVGWRDGRKREIVLIIKDICGQRRASADICDQWTVRWQTDTDRFSLFNANARKMGLRVSNTEDS
jgi:hypothetical protein